jgi:non-specific serine/threonine protein kinase/serine/threonine-protein kinase
MTDTAERWVAAKTVFAAALEYCAAERQAFVREACGHDALLCTEVESLLAAHEEESDFLSDSVREQLRAAVTHQATHPAALSTGDRLGPYRIIREIGRGGMGTVYLAERADAVYQKRVAIKLVTRGMDTEMVLRRFRAERQILAELDHPNIARLLEGGTSDDGLPFFVMEYIEGVAIDEYCTARGLSVEARLDLFRQVCAAVHYAHQRLVVHRDIKPGNILVSADGTPKLLDFGVAKLLTPARTGETTAVLFRPMTPEYSSPEQLTGGSVTTLADVYSLGVLLYQLLTGKHPYASARGDSTALVRAIEAHAPVRPSTAVVCETESGHVAAKQRQLGRTLSGDLDTIVLTAMRREPERRYASPEALSDDVHRYLRGLPVVARADTLSYRAVKFARRNRAPVTIAVLAAISLIAAVAAFGRQAHIANEHRAVAERRFAQVRSLALSLLFEVHDSIAALPGATRARDLIVTRSLQALDALSREDAMDPSLQRDLAAGYLKVGDVQGRPYGPNLGETDAALASYRRSAALLAPLFAERPADVDARRALAAAHTRIGEVELRLRRLRAAEGEERSAIALLSGLAERPHPALVDRISLGDALIFLGDALLGSDDAWSVAHIVAAREAYARALALRTSVLADAPNDPTAIQKASVAHNRLGYVGSSLAKVTGDTSQLSASLSAHRASQALRLRLLTLQPRSAEVRRLAADGWMDIAQVEETRGDRTAALASFGRAGPTFEALSAADPANVEARRDLAYFHENFGELLAQLQRRVQAAREERTAITILRAVRRADPASVEELYHIVHADETLGDALQQLRQPDGALAAYADAKRTLNVWEQAEPGAARIQRLRANLSRRSAATTR